MTIPVVWGVAVLLQEVVLEQFGHFQGDFISFCQRRLKKTSINYFRKKWARGDQPVDI